MKLIREYIKELLVEQEEGQSELEKLQDIFANNGAQAVELGEMILPDSPEVQAMREIVDSTRSFLELFEDPAQSYTERQKQRDPWNMSVYNLLEDVGVKGPGHPTNPYGRQDSRGRKMVDMFFELGQAYINLEGIVGFGKLLEWMPKIEEVVEWAGAPTPKIPEEWSPK